MIYDVIMAGGGVMGCATAYYLLLTDPTLKVAIVEKDPSYVQSSTVLSDGNIRVQFNLKENIQISLYGLEMLARFSEDMAVDGHKPAISFRQEGNLFLTDEAGRDDALAGMRLQQSLGGQVEWFTSEQVVAR
ncbi:MAG: FAD-binding oxidoreductase, partial [Anaerolineae bacterium]|nr:FAD-binding oxidoreductase [Anaerolineae bacterium]